MDIIDAVLQGREALAINKICHAQQQGEHWERPFLSHPLGDTLLDTATAWIQSHMQQTQGYVYMVVNPSQPGLYKVGKTKKHMASRLKGLNNEAIPVDFVVVGVWPVLNYHQAETQLHQLLATQYTKKKEFFAGDYKTLLPTIGSFLTAWHETHLPLCHYEQQQTWQHEWDELSSRYTLSIQ